MPTLGLLEEWAVCPTCLESFAPVTGQGLLVPGPAVPVSVLQQVEVEFSLWRQKGMCVYVDICFLSNILSLHPFILFFCLVND